MTTLAKKTPYLVRKGDRFYFRIRVPEDLRQVIGKAEHSEALGDVNKAQAEVLAAQHGANWQERFLHERYALGTASAPPAEAPQPAASVRYATPEQAQAVAAIAGRALLAVDEESRIEGWAWDIPRTPEGFGPGAPPETALPLAVSGRNLEGIAMAAEDWLGAYGLALPPAGTERRRVLYAYAQGIGKADSDRRRRDAGEVVETPPEPQAPALLAENAATSAGPANKPAHLLTLRDVFELWKAKSETPALKSINIALRVVEEFEEVTGNPPLQRLTWKEGLKLRDHYLASGKAPSTTKNLLGWVSTLLRYEMSEGRRLQSDPWSSIKVEKADEAVTIRKATRAGELGSLFALPLFQQYELPTAKNAGKDAAYWVPVLGVYTGARITELAQLLVADVFLKDGLWRLAFRVTHPEWQSLKNKPSWREVPLHPELVRLGFLDYCKAMRDAGHDRLFPLVQVSDTNNAGGSLSSWFSKLKGKAGWEKEHTFHSFRHGVETMLKRAKEPKSHIDRYTGHAGDSVADRDYTHLEPEDLVETVGKVRPEGLALARVFPPPGWAAPAAMGELLKAKSRSNKTQ